MQPLQQASDKPNPNAPAELAHFAFLLGHWRCQAKIKRPDGNTQTYPATWHGHYILDGYAIADEYRMTNPANGDLIVLGTNMRSYNTARNTWNIRWLNALDGSWTDLASKELGGVQINGASISYAFQEPAAAHAYTRATYTSLSHDHFTWRGDQSDDAEHWTHFMVVDCHRDHQESQP